MSIVQSILMEKELTVYSITKTITLLLTLFILGFTAQSQAAKYKEGEHYIVVSEQQTAKPELKEYFSYYCPTCRAYEPYLASFKKAMPSQAAFTKVHVDFMGQTSTDIQFMLSKALIIAEKLNIDKKFSAEVFKHIQTDRATINDASDVRKLFIKSGGEGKKFDQGMQSFSVVAQAKRYKKVQDVLSKNRQLTSVPTMVVNGKYLVVSKSLDRNNFFADYNALVAYLFTL